MNTDGTLPIVKCTFVVKVCFLKVNIVNLPYMCNISNIKRTSHSFELSIVQDMSYSSCGGNV